MFNTTTSLSVAEDMFVTGLQESTSTPTFSQPSQFTIFKLLMPLPNTSSHYLACFPKIALTVGWSVMTVTLIHAGVLNYVRHTLMQMGCS